MCEDSHVFFKVLVFSKIRTVFLTDLDFGFLSDSWILVFRADLDSVFRDSDWFLLRTLDLKSSKKYRFNFVFQGLDFVFQRLQKKEVD
jgi:hypothetical protein